MKRSRWVRRAMIGFLCVNLLLGAAAAEDAGCAHSYEEKQLPPDCVNPGARYFECSKCGHQYGHESIPALGHSFGEWVTDHAPGCETEGRQLRCCSRCGVQEEALLPALGHAYERRQVEPTCTKVGYTEHVCSRCGDKYRTDEVPPAGHRCREEVTQPTCTKEGAVYQVCTACGHREKLQSIPAAGHEFDGGTVTKEPTVSAMGRITYTCIRCGETRSERIPRRHNPFCDVDKKDYFFDPVLWAVENGITSGTDQVHFSPNMTCTRAQVVTFLWKAMGAPAPASQDCPFADVSADAYYSQAVLWAAEQGITAGVDATHFGPGQGCTRAQVMTFFHRAKGQPEYEASDRFSDVRRSDYFFGPVCWAAQSGITAGADESHFAPGQTCTRGQIVTFLYRDHTNG